MPVPPAIDLGSGIDVQDTIRKLIEVEREPLRRLERDNRQYQTEVQAWEKLRSHTKNLADKSRAMHSVASPFSERLLISGDPGAIGGTVLNGAQAIRKKIHVEQLASHHELHSRPISMDKQIPPGRFTVQTKQEKRSLRFPGGKAEQFKDFLSEKLKDLLEVSEFDTDEKKKIYKLRSRLSGKQGQLEFKDPDSLLARMGILEKRRLQTNIELDPMELSAGSGNSRLRYKIQGGGQKLLLSQGTVRLKLKEAYPAKKEAFLHLRTNAKKAPPQQEDDPRIHKIEEIKTGPDIAVQVGDVRLSGKHISRSRRVPIGDRQYPQDSELPQVKTRISLIYEHKGKQKSHSFSRSLPEGHSRKWKLPLTKLPKGARIQALRFYTNGQTEVAKLYFDSPQELRPRHESQQAQDTVLKMDGVRLRRSKNTDLKDIVPGASLELKGTTAGPVNVEIKADEDKIIKKIEEWLEAYNGMNSYLRENMRTTNKTRISPPAAENQQRQRRQGGFFATDSTARQLKSQADTIIAAAYPAEPKGFRVLPEIGISTGQIGSRWEDIRAGLLKLEKEKLISAIGKNPGGVQKLFGSDTNKDLQIDNGVAWKLAQTLKPYNQSANGLISLRIELLKTKISSNKDRIYRGELVLERKKESLRHQFGRMEKAIKRNRSLGDYLKQTAPSRRNDSEN